MTEKENMKTYILTQEMMDSDTDLLTNEKYIRKQLNIDFDCVLDFQRRVRKIHTDIKSNVLADFIFFCLNKAKQVRLIVTTTRKYNAKEEKVSKAQCSDQVKSEILRLSGCAAPTEMFTTEQLQSLSDWDLYYLLSYCKFYDINLGPYSMQAVCNLWNEYLVKL